MKKPLSTQAKRCSRKKESWCGAMEQFSSDQYGTGKRIFLTRVMNMKTMKEDNPRAAYQFSLKRIDFVWLNYCPWCGGNIK